MVDKILLKDEAWEMKGGENSHLKASLKTAVDEQGENLGKDVYSSAVDRGLKERKVGWTNVGDISACLRTSVALGEQYKNTETPYIVVASKHTRPVIIAKGKTQLEATIKAIAGDLNSPFGGFWGFNTPLELDTAQFIDKVFLEGTIAPAYEKGAIEILTDTSKVNAHKNRFLLESGYMTLDEVNVFRKSLQPVACARFIEQDREPPFNARKECSVVTGNNGNTDINSLDDAIVDDINFAGNAAIYLSSNLVFFVHNGAIAGLGDGCGARVVAARKARNMLEESAYAALSANTDYEWSKVLFDTPFKREDFECIKMPLQLTAFSDAFFPKPDGFIETAGIDRLNKDFQDGKVIYTEGKKEVIFIPKRKNFNPDYDQALIPKVVIQPGGSLGDKIVVPMAEKYAMKMVFTMTPEIFTQYKETGKGTGRRFFGHIIM